MTSRGARSSRRVNGLVLLAGASVLLLTLLPAGEPDGDGPNAPAAATAQSTTSTTTDLPPTEPPATTAATTTIPPIEAVLPLTVDTVIDRIAPSVGFVLTQQGTGSGVVINDELLVTNAHVVWPDQAVSLVFRNGATFKGRVLAIDPFVDLAVVDISRLSRKPPPLALGSTEGIASGDELWIVGYPNPFEFTPEPTVDLGEVTGLIDWEYSGVRWVTVAAPAIGGQSGGAVVDSAGRLVGISTFGSISSLTSIGVDDVVARVEEMLSDNLVRGLEPRSIPHSGARRAWDVALEGAWDQQLFIGWLPATAEVTLAAPASGLELAVRTIDGSRLAEGIEQVEFRPGFAFPVVVAAESSQPTNGRIDVSLPLISYTDPDDGRVLSRVGTATGLYDVGRDRDFFYLDLAAGEDVTVTIESAARTHLWVYDPDGEVVAEDVDESGFIGSSAAVQVNTRIAGRYVVALENSLSTVSGYSVVTR